VIASDGGRPVASPLPFRLIEQDGKVPKLEFPRRHAPIRSAQIAEKGGNLARRGAGARRRMSRPDWYASAEQVPTWLYEAGASLRSGAGHSRAITPRGHTERLSHTFEKWLAPKPEWKLDKVADKRREMLLKAIVAVEMTVESIEGNFKLNQHKSDADHVAVANALVNKAMPRHAKSANGWSRCDLTWITYHPRLSAGSRVEGARHDPRRHQAGRKARRSPTG
jgi:transcriptional regulator